MRLIDADALQNEYKQSHEGKRLLLIDVAPTIEPEPKKGRWIPQDYNKRTGYVTTTVYYYPKCSECGHSGNYSMNFCPNCGADMREGEERD